MHSAAFSLHGKFVVTASEDNTARVWEAATGQEVARMTHESYVYAVAFSPDGLWLATTSGSTAREWLWRPEDLIAEARARTSPCRGSRPDT